MRHQMQRWCVGIFAATIASAVSAAPAPAQSLWTHQDRESAVWLEVLRPEFAGEEDVFRFATSTAFLSGRWNVGSEWDVFVELPFAYGDVKEDVSLGMSTTTVGNPYLGIEYGRARSPLSVEFGARIPVASDDADNFGTIVGQLTDNVERWEAFIDEWMPVTGRVNYVLRSEEGLAVRLRGGSALWIPLEDGLDTELLGSYGARVGYEGERFSVGGVFIGRALITEGDLTFDERTYHQAGVAADARFGDFRTGLQFRVPLDEDMNDVMDYVVGLSVGATIR